MTTIGQISCGAPIRIAPICFERKLFGEPGFLRINPKRKGPSGVEGPFFSL
jgi:hypothetical protein